MELKSKTALVTGGAVRIGEAICRALAAEGCTVAVHCNRSVTAAGRLVDSIQTGGGRAFVVQGELGSPDQCRAIVESACEKAGGIDILINNAAVFHKDTLVTGEGDGFTAELQINTVAPSILARAFAECPRSDGTKGGRRIINLLGRRIAGVDSESLSYSVSKKMLAELTMQWAVEFAPEITVNGVAPGAILPPPGREGERTADLAGNAPLDIECAPDDIASAILFLLEMDCITGQIVFVDGGQHLVTE